MFGCFLFFKAAVMPSENRLGAVFRELYETHQAEVNDPKNRHLKQRRTKKLDPAVSGFEFNSSNLDDIKDILRKQ